MTRDELIALLLMVGFVQDTPTEGYPHREHVYYTDRWAVSIVPDEEWGVWGDRDRDCALARDCALDLALALARAYAYVCAHTYKRDRGRAYATGTPSEYSKCWQTIKELIDD